jgi:two-component sensor histidine kinase
MIHPDDLPVLRAWWSEVEAAGHIHRPAEYRVLAKDGSVRWHQLSGRLTDNPHEELIGICRDITSLKQTEDELRAALAQRDTVFRELKHRTRNSLSVISSLLSLGTDSGVPMSAEKVVERARGSVDAILGLYEKLDARMSGLTVDLDRLLEDVARRTMEIFGGHEPAVTLLCDIPSVGVDTNMASALGLVVNESVTNALKHSFGSGSGSRSSADSGGTIRVQARCDEHSFTLRIEDDGPGAESPAESSGAHGFGLQLVRDLAQQLHGRASFEGIPEANASGIHAVVVSVPLTVRSDAG